MRWAPGRWFAEHSTTADNCHFAITTHFPSTAVNGIDGATRVCSFGAWKT
jgi:hypothetical protein